MNESTENIAFFRALRNLEAHEIESLRLQAKEEGSSPYLVWCRRNNIPLVYEKLTEREQLWIVRRMNQNGLLKAIQQVEES